MSAPVTVPRTAIPRIATADVLFFCALATRGAASASAATAISAQGASARQVLETDDEQPIRIADEPRRWAVTRQKAKGPARCGALVISFRAGSGGLGHVRGLRALLA